MVAVPAAWATWWRAQTLFCLVGFWFSWQWAAWSRSRARRALRKRGTASTSFCDGEDDATNPGDDGARPGLRRRGRGEDERKKDAPKVSVVMPVKGVHPESLSNWRTQLRSAYRGEVEYIFVVESGDLSLIHI